jgi:hypothetical protein
VPIITDTSGYGGLEGFILDPDGDAPLNLGNNGPLRLAALTMTPAQKLPQWASNADTDGQALVRNPYHGNRDGCSMQVRVATPSMTQAMDSIGILEAKLQEACLQGADNGPGLAFDWTPAGATVTLRGYMLLGQITDVPITYDDAWFAAMPIVTVPFVAKPFLYGPEVTAGSAIVSDPLLTLEVDDVAGDVPAEARLVLTADTGEERRWAEWGLESRFFDSVSPSELFIDSADLDTSGFAGSSTALDGAYGGSAISATLISRPVAVCGTGDQDHVGTFRVKARVWPASIGEYWRMTWQDGDGLWSSNSWAQPIIAEDFNELDLGLVDITEAESGDQTWSGRIEAYTSTSGGELGALDYLVIFPVNEGYGRLEAAYSYVPGGVVEHDEFTGTTAGSALNGHTAPVGGSWATSGATTDFTFADGPASGDESVQRATTSDSDFRYGILGSTITGDVEVAVDTQVAYSSGDANAYQAVVAAWTDSDNLVRLKLNPITDPSLLIQQVSLALEFVYLGTAETIAGGNGISGLVTVDFSNPSWLTLRLIMYAATGRAIGLLLDSTGSTLLAVDGFLPPSTFTAGQVGIADQCNASGFTRYYDNFAAGIPNAEPLIINPDQALEITSSENRRWSADGSTYGDIPSRGSRLFIPQAGDAGRSSRIAVRAIREDPITMASRNDGADLTAEIFVTPRYLAVPRG